MMNHVKSSALWQSWIRPCSYLVCWFAVVLSVSEACAVETERPWRILPLINQGRIDSSWFHIGWGGFVVDDGAIRTECDPRGLGLLVYKKERLGNCQIRIIFKSEHTRSNAGVFVRIADGILDQAGNPGAAFDRNNEGKISGASGQQMRESSDKEEGPWFAVHHGYEVQIMDEADPFHRTGAIYSLAPSSRASAKPTNEWRSMIITLSGRLIFVEVDGERVTTFDPDSPDVPPAKEWYEPKREARRPEVGYLGLQNHDPGDVVWFKEVAVRPLEGRAGASLP